MCQNAPCTVCSFHRYHVNMEARLRAIVGLMAVECGPQGPGGVSIKSWAAAANEDVVFSGLGFGRYALCFQNTVGGPLSVDVKHFFPFKGAPPAPIRVQIYTDLHPSSNCSQLARA